MRSSLEITLAWLKRKGTKANVAGMARYAIRADKVFGVSVADLRERAKGLGRDHDLAQALWATGWYEARMLACLVDDPKLVTPAQMDRWCRDFENWAICDTACFHLFDRTPHAWRKVELWSERRGEFVKRAAFALIASLALHDKRAADEPFLRALRLIERDAIDGRNFVKKAVSWALRGIGGRNQKLNAACVATATRLSMSLEPSARWVGKDALREFRARRLSRPSPQAPPKASARSARVRSRSST